MPKGKYLEGREQKEETNMVTKLISNFHKTLWFPAIVVFVVLHSLCSL